MRVTSTSLLGRFLVFIVATSVTAQAQGGYSDDDRCADTLDCSPNGGLFFLTGTCAIPDRGIPCLTNLATEWCRDYFAGIQTALTIYGAPGSCKLDLRDDIWGLGEEWITRACICLNARPATPRG